MPLSGVVRKMQAVHENPIRYSLPVGEEMWPVNEYIGSSIKLSFSGQIFCIHCQRKTNKSFSQGYCFPCFKTLAQCDMCIMKPETCHYHLGTCREPEWADSHCMQDHYVYLANSSGVKVGITRGDQLPTRWIDQGAYQALPIFRVKNRFYSGLIEAALKKFVADRTDWRKMLKGEPESLDLKQRSQELLSMADDSFQAVQQQHPDLDWLLLDEEVREFHYPVEQYPLKVSSQNFDKTSEIEGMLLGIKGQYLILDTGVLNIRKFTGYELSVQV